MAQPTRKLTAIVAMDVVGYSRLMGDDESGTHARLKALRAQLIEPAVARHNGRLFKLVGDGVLVDFPSAVEALSAAIEIQQTATEAQKSALESHPLSLRIGLHLGDVLVDDEDLYGDGVNVAVRLEAAAPVGGSWCPAASTMRWRVGSRPVLKTPESSLSRTSINRWRRSP